VIFWCLRMKLVKGAIRRCSNQFGLGGVGLGLGLGDGVGVEEDWDWIAFYWFELPFGTEKAGERA